MGRPRTIPSGMTKLARLVDRALDGRSVAEAAQISGLPYHRIWDILHERSVNPTIETMVGLERLGIPHHAIVNAILDKEVRPTPSTGNPVKQTA